MWRARELEDLIGCWTLDEADLGLIANKSGATRLRFALALKFFEQEARFPRHAGELPPAAGEVRSGPGQGRSGYVRRVRVVGSDGRVSPGAAQAVPGFPASRWWAMRTSWRTGRRTPSRQTGRPGR